MLDGDTERREHAGPWFMTQWLPAQRDTKARCSVSTRNSGGDITSNTSIGVCVSVCSRKLEEEELKRSDFTLLNDQVSEGNAPRRLITANRGGPQIVNTGSNPPSEGGIEHIDRGVSVFPPSSREWPRYTSSAVRRLRTTHVENLEKRPNYRSSPRITHR